MTDDELRRQAHKVAEALGLGRELPRYQCGRCGCKWLTNTTPRCVQCGEEERVSHIGMAFMADDLLTDAGALVLQDAIVKQEQAWFLRLHRYMQREEAGPREYFSVFIKDIEKGQEFHRSQDHADTWPAALVLAAHAALEAGWLGGVVGES